MALMVMTVVVVILTWYHGDSNIDGVDDVMLIVILVMMMVMIILIVMVMQILVGAGKGRDIGNEIAMIFMEYYCYFDK